MYWKCVQEVLAPPLLPAVIGQPLISVSDVIFVKLAVSVGDTKTEKDVKEPVVSSPLGTHRHRYRLRVSVPILMLSTLLVQYMLIPVVYWCTWQLCWTCACTAVKLVLDKHAEESCSSNMTAVEKNQSNSIMYNGLIRCSVSVSVGTEIQWLVLYLFCKKKKKETTGIGASLVFTTRAVHLSPVR